MRQTNLKIQNYTYNIQIIIQNVYTAVTHVSALSCVRTAMKMERAGTQNERSDDIITKQALQWTSLGCRQGSHSLIAQQC